MSSNYRARARAQVSDVTMLLLNNKLSVETRGRPMTHDASAEKPGIFVYSYYVAPWLLHLPEEAPGVV
jgi:hypothetical protein